MKKITDMYGVDETELTHAFQDACANQDFKKFVASLNTPEDVLKNYTSSLEDAFQEFEHCANCKGLSTCKNHLQGYRYTPIVEGKCITFSYDACPKMNQKIKEEAYKENLSLFEMSEDIKEASFKNIYKDDKARVPIIKYFKEFMEQYTKGEKPKGLYLNGSFGSGKTYIIASLFNEMAKKGTRSIMIYYPEFLRSLKSSFQTDYEEKMEQTKKIPLLLLDDIGAENVTPWARDEVLGIIVQYRMENHLPTFFTSNLTLEELEKALAITTSGVEKVKSRRIIERIKQLTIPMELISKNRRD